MILTTAAVYAACLHESLPQAVLRAVVDLRGNSQMVENYYAVVDSREILPQVKNRADFCLHGRKEREWGFLL